MSVAVNLIAILTFCFVLVACIVGIMHDSICDDWSIYSHRHWTLGSEICSFIAFLIMFVVASALFILIARDACSDPHDKKDAMIVYGHECYRHGVALKELSIKPDLNMRYMVSAFGNSGAYESEINSTLGELLKNRLAGKRMGFDDYRFSLSDVNVDIRNSTVKYVGSETNVTHEVTLPIVWHD